MFSPPPPGAHCVWHIHRQSCTCNSLTCITMTLTVLSSVSPCIALSSDSTEHHHRAHFSPNRADNAGEPPQFYLSCLILMKNSLVGPYNYRLITAVKNITDTIFFLLVCLMACTWDTQYALLSAEHFNMQLSACLVLHTVLAESL